MVKSPFFSPLYLTFLTVLFYLPLILKPSVLFSRGNDLQQYFWPLFYYTQQNILTNHTLPLWNNLFLSGAPLLPDPQSFLFYLPNLLFLLTSLNQGIILSLILHTLLGGLGIYLTAKQVFHFSKFASLFTASLYIITPRLAGYLEAGHFGLVLSMAGLPFILLSTLQLTKKPTAFWAAVLALSLSQVYYTHSITFLVAIVSSLGIFLSLILLNHFTKWLTSFIYYTLGGMLTLGLIAITFLPQLQWTPQTTRSLLLTAPQTYPQWLSYKEIGGIIFYPASFISGTFSSSDTEKWLVIGIMPLILATIGFFKINRRLQIIVGLTSLAITLLVLNNLSPFYSLLISQDWYKLIRVSTRFWIIIIFLVIFLAGLTINHLSVKKSSQKMRILIIILAFGESIFLSWSYLFKPLPPQKEFVTPQIIKFLNSDKEKFRVFCLNRCISQQDAAVNNLELVEGYSTLQQLNYFKQSWQLAGGYWNYYTLAIPPIGAANLKPDAVALGEYNTKYLISPYPLTDPNLKLQRQLDGFFIYQNHKFLPRAYFKTNQKMTNIEAPITSFSPNHIRVGTAKQTSSQLILAEVYSLGWKAYLNGQEEVLVEQTPIALRQVEIKADTTFVDFKYQPDLFKAGSIITSLTVLIIGGVFWKQARAKHRKNG